MQDSREDEGAAQAGLKSEDCVCESKSSSESWGRGGGGAAREQEGVAETPPTSTRFLPHRSEPLPELCGGRRGIPMVLGCVGDQWLGKGCSPQPWSQYPLALHPTEPPGMAEIGLLINRLGRNLERNSKFKKEKDDVSAWGTTAPRNTEWTWWGAAPMLDSILGTLGFEYQQSMGVCRVPSFQALLIWLLRSLQDGYRK